MRGDAHGRAASGRACAACAALDVGGPAGAGGGWAGRSDGPEGRGERAFAVLAFAGVLVWIRRVNRVKPPLRGAMDGGRMLRRCRKLTVMLTV